jgi:ppGpp synthetase/RelA/SpoT-type nucleotidyltranferase
MSERQLTENENSEVEAAVNKYQEHRHLFESFAGSLMNYFSSDATLKPYIHFIKYRTKDPDHLRKKLIRKCLSGELVPAAGLFERITDLAGVRIIHLHTDQLRAMHPAILQVLHEYVCDFVEAPTANCWDSEFESIFQSLQIETRSRASMYTTVHYVVRANQRTPISCEIQVRTLMDEVWGEVSHRVNYPEPSTSEACQDQLKVLARLTTGCTRLVDSIFRTHGAVGPQPEVSDAQTD